MYPRRWSIWDILKVELLLSIVVIIVIAIPEFCGQYLDVPDGYVRVQDLESGVSLPLGKYVVTYSGSTLGYVHFLWSRSDGTKSGVSTILLGQGGGSGYVTPEHAVFIRGYYHDLLNGEGELYVSPYIRYPESGN